MTAIDKKSAASDRPRNERRMSLGAHLVELRRRLMICAAALIVAMIIAFFVTDPIIQFITAPVDRIAQEHPEVVVGLTFSSVTAPFDLRMRMAFSIGIFLAAPIWLWQIWAYIMPGMTRKEIKYTIGFVAAAIPLFFAGCYVGSLVVPHVIELMANFTPEGANNLYEGKLYFDFILNLMLVLGVSFVLPVFLVALNVAGIISGRDIIKGWRVAVLIATVFAALATPAADVVSMLLLAGILVVLFFAAAALSMIFDRRRKKQMKADGLLPETDA